MRAPEFAGAQAEFLTAHEHYRHGNGKETLVECLKAFESVIKIICQKQGWAHPPNATSKALLDVLFENELIPMFWQQHLLLYEAPWKAEFQRLASPWWAWAGKFCNRSSACNRGVCSTYDASAIVFLCEMAG